MTPQLLTVIDIEKLKSWSLEEWKNWWIEPKYDGARLIYNRGQFLSRTGKPLNNLDHIAEEINSCVLADWVLDGELVGEDWADTMSKARSSQGKKDGSGLSFRVFDALSQQEWQSQECILSTEIRRARLHWMVGYNDLSHVVEVRHYVVKNFAEFSDFHTAFLKHGCDGTVLKRKDSMYEFKRTKTWLKVKPVETFDGVVVGIYEGKGKFKGMLGGLEVEFSGIQTNVSGMTDDQRMQWWDHPGMLVGKTVEVAARGKHKSGCLIEPRFIRIREDL